MDEYKRHMVGHMEIDCCRSRSLSGDASTRKLERGMNLLIEGEKLIACDEENARPLGTAKFGKLKGVT